MHTLVHFLSSGILDLRLWQLVLLTFASTHLTIISITVYLHRALAHRSLVLNPAVAGFFKFWVWLTTSMVAIQWAGVHRKHHAKCETPEDPHSPVVLGVGQVLRFGSELYRKACQDSESVSAYTKDIKPTAFDSYSARHSNQGIVGLLILEFILLGLPGVAVWCVQMLWSPVLAAGVINGLGHWVGYKNHEVRDNSTNLLPIGLLIGGEELHNNHHANPTSPKLSYRWYEFDAGWMYIRILEFFKLASVRKKASILKFTTLSPSDLRMKLMFTLNQAIRKKDNLVRRCSELELQLQYEELLFKLHTLKEKCLNLFEDRSLKLEQLENELLMLIEELKNCGLKIKLS